MSKPKLSVVLATRNEEKNIGDCLKSVKSVADETIVFDEESNDKTCEIARKLGAKVFSVKHEAIFHKTKQKALEAATHDWILQLDADEVVTPALAKEIKKVIAMPEEELLARRPKSKKKEELFRKHQKLIEKRGGKIDKKVKTIVAFFLPRLNFFLGKPLRHAGVYPDANIRLIKKGKARFPATSVHEQMEVDGEIAWLFNDLEHHDSPTFERYLTRMNRYTDLATTGFEKQGVSIGYWNIFYYSFIKPIIVFVKLYIRHKGFLDGMRGFIWSIFSAFHFPIAYFKYWQTKRGGKSVGKIRVAIDSGPLTGGHAIRGVGAYTTYLIKHLRKIKDLKIEAVDFQKADLSKYDIVHYPYFHPFFITLPLFKKTTTIVTIHDLIPLIYPKYYPPGIRGKIRYFIQKILIKKVDVVIAVSETSKKDIVRLLNIPQEKIKVIYEASKNVFKSIPKDSGKLKEVSKRYKLPKKFVLYVGDVNYNKNILGLADACKIAKIPLVIVGKQAKVENFDRDHPENKSFVEFLEKYSKDAEIIRLGFVPDDDLVAVYNLASLYFQPSFYEGFGLPVLEAFACGTPVVVAKTQALVEIAGGAALIANPKNTKDMAKKILSIVKSLELKARLILKGKERAKEFSWDKTAKQTSRIYRKI
jgi:glycosyltransferase involved in cell wall biosynthesis